MSKEEEEREKVTAAAAASEVVVVNGGGGEEEGDGVRALHARVEAEWGPVMQSACQTAAARACGARVRDPAAGVLAGEVPGGAPGADAARRGGRAREVHGVMIAVRTLWFDARVEAAVASLGGPAQVVLLGAGN